MLETRGSADVIYLDLGRSGGHETTLGWAAYDEAVKEFAGLVLSLRDTGEISPQDPVCVHTVRSDRFLIFLGEGARDDAGRSAAARRERIVDALRRKIEQLPPTSPLRSLRLVAGHARIVEEPM